MQDIPDYYQILQVQPDAPAGVVRHNYRLLLNKLRMHPDLGGSKKQAILINAAYETLMDPQKRAAYNQRLSTRGLYPFLPVFPGKTTAPSGRTWKKNRRNYYRILQVHPEANPEIIKARYRVLTDASDPPHDLFHEAFGLLNDPDKRTRYDQLLKRYSHLMALEIMQAESNKPEEVSETGYPVPADPDTRVHSKQYSPIPLVLKNYGRYRSRITLFCEFCKTCYTAASEDDKNQLCPVCSSPSAKLGKDMFGKSSRLFERRKKSETIHFYPDWPGQKQCGRLFDISPSGLRFQSQIRLRTGQIIKIESPQFKAVAEVVHCREEKNMPSYGVRFRTVCFGSEPGYFLAASA